MAEPSGNEVSLSKADGAGRVGSVGGCISSAAWLSWTDLLRAAESSSAIGWCFDTTR